MDVIQDGDAEGTLRFDPTDRQQARAAMQAVGAYRRPRRSPEQVAAATAQLERWRATKNGAFGAEKPTIVPKSRPEVGRG